MIEILLPLLFALAVIFSIWFVLRIVNAVPEEDRTYADKPPKMLQRIWPLITIVTYYVGSYLSVEYREKTIRRLRKVELDYALSPQQWFASRIVYALIFFLITWLLALWLGSGGLMLPACAMVFGFFYLEIWLRDKIKVVEIQVLKGLPNFLDMLTLAIESGCNLTVGINIAVEKTPDSPLKRAFARLLREVRSGRTRIDGLRTLEERMDISVVTSLTSALVQAEKTGASLGSVLRAQSTQRTNERFARAEKLAMEAPVKMLGPLILCIFPCTFVVLGFPIGMKMMNAFQ
ncbi:type II secretion system F family protein [Undibacterium sp. CY21W]|uniref:type II secretion system F family protein n=1 Tax=Undibacterium sp. CY21W TaxID=2762293 RepID=UPI00164A5519|nr:type II secretion system F family protein [Undibacterium sp. CY21W]MBC3927417.1 type II secretion system F family protein [Undibacterium sp. CY21W]